jgi:SAM-dependent methyltransferase
MIQVAPRTQIRHTLKSVNHVVSELGFSPHRLLSFVKGLPVFFYQSLQYSRQSRTAQHALPISGAFPCITDRYENAGKLDRHYFLQDIWAARKIFQNKPEKHVDVGSRVDGFVAHLLSFRDVEVLDIRALESPVAGMTFHQANLMDSATVPTSAYDSVSCLHALEHFGLGRYGDPIDPDGHVKGLNSLIQMLKPGGKLILSVPIGRERVEFNGHRVFDPCTIVQLAQPSLTLEQFAYIDDQGILHDHALIQDLSTLVYGCGLFEFLKSS